MDTLDGSAPDDKVILESVVNFSLFDRAAITSAMGSRLVWQTSEIPWVSGNKGCLNFYIFLKPFADFTDTNFIITVRYKNSINGETRDEKIWSARDYISDLEMVIYELNEIQLTIDAPLKEEDYVSVHFDQSNAENWAYFKDPQARVF